jgi:DNA repair exonuclease SbcCD ATPase subunit
MSPQAAPQTPEAVSLETSRAAQEAALTVLAGLDARIEAVNVSLRNLHAVDGEVFGHDQKRAHVASLDKVQEAPCAAHKSSECPTCGQTLPADLRQSRETDLLATLTALASERLSQVSVADDLRSAVDYAMLIFQTREQLAKILENKLENQGDCEAAEAAKRLKDDDALRIERELAIKTVERAELEREFRRLEGDKEREAAAAGEHYVELQARESALRKTLDALREAESTWTSLEGKTNSTLALLEDRVRQAQDKHRVQAEILAELQAVMAGLKAQENDITARGLVLERLGEVLGPRGIQHYVFMSTLKQLEAIANAYLQVLAEGGVQLTLQGDEDADRIVKTVWVRAADGAMRERGLSQLSGGQWRRVSMALDLAFAEIIRRRGSLRSNLIVMDEVLTHLDASGREAVGSVLRAMVDGPRAGEIMPEVDSSPGSESGEEKDKDNAFAVSQELSRSLLGGGAYETAIVILQDLSAMELEEAFDHVDVVVKATDTSKVLIDGN